MSAKKAKSKANLPASQTSSAPLSAVPASAAATSFEGATTAAVAMAESPPAWIDSPDPRRRMIGKIVLVAAWIYVAALWLLALDQTFHWGIFGPKVPLVP